MTSCCVLSNYFTNFTKDEATKFALMQHVYDKYNERVNLISRKDICNLYEHHILHSLSIAKFCKFDTSCKVIDVGTGGGFPGIPLAIHFPNTKFFLIDSINKKIDILNKIVEDLSLENVYTQCCRAENIVSKYDFVIGRGVTHVDKFVALTKHLLERDGKIIYLNGISDVTVKCKVTKFELRNIFKQQYFQTKQIVVIENIN